MKNLLFPNKCQPVGWILFIPSLILGIMRLLGFMDVNGVREIIINDIAIIGIVLGALFIVCSREKIEDELTRSIRLSSLLNSIYFYAILLIICTLAINGLDFIYFTIANLALLPIIFVCIFRLEMHRYSKMSNDEE